MNPHPLKSRELDDMKNIAIAVTTALLAAGCAVGPDYNEPKAALTDRYGQFDQAVFSAEDARPHFWTDLNDETLTKLVDDSLAANHDLRIALARYTEARALRRQATLDLAPTVTAGGGYTKQQVSQDQTFPGVPRTNELYDAGFDAFWELDFFGRVRRNIEASSAEVQSAEANLHDAQVLVTAEVSRTYFELRGQQSQLDVARRNVDNQKATLDLTTHLLDAGRGTELDTSRAQAQLSTTLATIAPLEAAVARSIHRLGVLTGRDPNALRDVLAAPKDLPAMPQLIAVGDPGALLRRRPDIRVAERDLAASTARIGVAIADLFPSVTFTGSIGYAAANTSSLGDSGSDTYLIGPGISWAAFDLGRVKARIAASRARNDEALARYEQTVLRALEETENSLVTHARARDRLAHVEQAAKSSRSAAQLARVRFENGIIDFLQVLDAERTQLEAEDRLAQSRTDVATSLIAVYKALGGGWEAVPPPGISRSAAASP
jgi:outer membrane protein, multidrug efflux system